MRRIQIQTAVLIAFLFLFTSVKSEAAFLSKIDDLFSNILSSSFRKAGKNIDEAVLLRKGDNFDSIIRKNGDLLNLPPKGTEDAAEIARKVGFLPGSRHFDDFLELSSAQRRLGSALSEVAEKVARSSNADDIVKVIGPRGLLVGARYGEGVVDNVYAIAKKEDLWTSLGTVSHRMASNAAEFNDVVSRLDKLKAVGIKIPASAYQEVGNFHKVFNAGDAISFGESILKKYGPVGLESMKRVLDTLQKLAKKYPTYTTIIVFAGLVRFAPNFVIDEGGKVVRNFNRIVDELVIVSTADATERVISAPVRITEQILNKWFPNLSGSIKQLIGVVVLAIIVFSLLYCFKPTRWIPLVLFAPFINMIRRKLNAQEEKNA